MKKREYTEKAKKITEQALPFLAQTHLEVMDEVERQMIGAFLFGMYYGLAFETKAAPEDVQAITIERLHVVLKYTIEQAVSFSGYLIDCTREENNPNVYAIIHRGIDGYYQLVEGRTEALRENIGEIKEVLMDRPQS